MTIEDFQDAMQTNCFGALHASLHALPFMRRQGWGNECFDSVLAFDGPIAISNFSNFEPCLVILDVMVPDSRIHADPACHRVAA